MPEPLDTFKAVLEPTAEGREISTTQAYVRFLTQLLRDKELGPRVVPILVDEARTFGMEGLFRQIGIYNPAGQKYTPVDKDQVMYYREDKAGQILQEGINEAGGMSSWIAAATSYSTNNRIMIPFYVYYSMFGFQRIGDLAWAAGDMQARGFLLGGTSGRTTLNGEGLQHEDGHSHILAGTIPELHQLRPDVRARGRRDPAARPEAHGREAGQRLLLPDAAQRELSACPASKPGTEEQIIKGMYLLQEAGGPKKKDAPRVNLLGSGTILRESHRSEGAARERLGRRPPTSGAARASTSSRATARTASAGTCCTRPRSRACRSWRSSSTKHAGPVIASTDYMKNYAEQIRAFIPKGRTYKVLGTDGFGRSDFRSKLREHFEVNRHYVVVAALKALADEGALPAAKVAEAIEKYGIDADKINPLYA